MTDSARSNLVTGTSGPAPPLSAKLPGFAKEVVTPEGAFLEIALIAPLDDCYEDLLKGEQRPGVTYILTLRRSKRHEVAVTVQIIPKEPPRRD